VDVELGDEQRLFRQPLLADKDRAKPFPGA
jgi:hypothetical protein